MNNNQKKCVDGSTIYYNLDTIPGNVVTKGPFEAVFLGNVISEMSEGCLFVKQQCKSQYPVVNAQNWRQWITSIDQENRISLAHTIENSGIPILYNTPRLCDPGISVSKNWSLRNYIETRFTCLSLYMITVVISNQLKMLHAIQQTFLILDHFNTNWLYLVLNPFL